MNKLEKAIKLRTEKRFEAAEHIFKELFFEDEMNANTNYQYAWLLDNLGKEKKAIKHYKKALENNLEIEHRADCYLGLGSSYRMIGKYKKSLKMFDNAILEFPENEELKIFRTLSLFKQKKYKKASSF